MAKFLLYIGEGKAFDLHMAESAIESVEGISDCRRGSFIGAVFECSYSSSKNSEAIVRISRNKETITIDGSGNDAVKLAFEIQKLYPKHIYFTDMSCSFNLNIMNFNSADDIYDVICKL